jgi:hypothetical protein
MGSKGSYTPRIIKSDASASAEEKGFEGVRNKPAPTGSLLRFLRLLLWIPLNACHVRGQGTAEGQNYPAAFCHDLDRDLDHEGLSR